MARPTNFAEVMHNVLHGKRFRVKQYIHVRPVFKRDAKGRFAGGLVRKGYTRKLLDRDAPMVTNMELMAENISTNNVLLSRLLKNGSVVRAASGPKWAP